VNASKHYDEDQLGALVSLIALMNAVNRMNVVVQQPGGDYQPGEARRARYSALSVAGMVISRRTIFPVGPGLIGE
jgi:hypothetical protein